MAKRKKRTRWDPLDDDLLRALVCEEGESVLVLSQVFACSFGQIRKQCRRLGLKPGPQQPAEASPPAVSDDTPGVSPKAVIPADAVNQTVPAAEPGEPDVHQIEDARERQRRLAREVRIILEAAGPLDLSSLMRQLQIAGVHSSEKEVLLAIGKDRGIQEPAPRKFRLVV